MPEATDSNESKWGWIPLWPSHLEECCICHQLIYAMAALYTLEPKFGRGFQAEFVRFFRHFGCSGPAQVGD